MFDMRSVRSASALTAEDAEALATNVTVATVPLTTITARSSDRSQAGVGDLALDLTFASSA